MTELTKREVLAALKKLGYSTSELKSYSIEYKAYSALQNKSLYLLTKRLYSGNRKQSPQLK